VSHLTKKSKGCLKAMISDADNFDLVFPPGATWQQKALLIASTLFIDYRLFEEKDGGNQNHHNY
jgi:Scramblase